MTNDELYAHLDEEHIEYLEERAARFREILIKRGKEYDRAQAIANRFCEIELKQRIRWD